MTKIYLKWIARKARISKDNLKVLIDNMDEDGDGNISIYEVYLYLKKYAKTFRSLH